MKTQSHQKSNRFASQGRAGGDLLIAIVGLALTAWFYLVIPSGEARKSEAAAAERQLGFLERVREITNETDPPRAVATIQTIGEGIKGVKSTVELSPGVTPGHGIEVTVRYELPTDERVCIGMTAYESISIGSGWTNHYHSNPPVTSGCIDRVPQRKAFLTVSAYRNDLPAGGTGLQGMMVDPAREEAKALRPDGFILVNLKIGDKYQLQRIDSPYFSKAAVQTASR